MKAPLETAGLTPEWRERLNKTIDSVDKDLSAMDTLFFTNYLEEEPQASCVQRRFNWFGKADPCPVPKVISRMVSSAEINLSDMSVDELIEALEQSKPTLAYSFVHLGANDGEVSVTYMDEGPESEDVFQQRLAQWHLNQFFLAEWKRRGHQKDKDESLARADRLEKEARELRKKFT